MNNPEMSSLQNSPWHELSRGIESGESAEGTLDERVPLQLLSVVTS